MGRSHLCMAVVACMSTTTTSITSVLNSLIETCKDGQEGFRAAAEAVNWTRKQLSEDDRQWLRDLKYVRMVTNFTIVAGDAGQKPAPFSSHHRANNGAARSRAWASAASTGLVVN